MKKNTGNPFCLINDEGKVSTNHKSQNYPLTPAPTVGEIMKRLYFLEYGFERQPAPTQPQTIDLTEYSEEVYKEFLTKFEKRVSSPPFFYSDGYTAGEVEKAIKYLAVRKRFEEIGTIAQREYNICNEMIVQKITQEKYARAIKDAGYDVKFDTLVYISSDYIIAKKCCEMKDFPSFLNWYMTIEFNSTISSICDKTNMQVYCKNFTKNYEKYLQLNNSNIVKEYNDKLALVMLYLCQEGRMSEMGEMLEKAYNFYDRLGKNEKLEHLIKKCVECLEEFKCKITSEKLHEALKANKSNSGVNKVKNFDLDFNELIKDQIPFIPSNKEDCQFLLQNFSKYADYYEQSNNFNSLAKAVCYLVKNKEYSQIGEFDNKAQAILSKQTYDKFKSVCNTMLKEDNFNITVEDCVGYNKINANVIIDQINNVAPSPLGSIISYDASAPSESMIGQGVETDSKIIPQDNINAGVPESLIYLTVEKCNITVQEDAVLGLGDLTEDDSTSDN